MICCLYKNLSLLQEKIKLLLIQLLFAHSQFNNTRVLHLSHIVFFPWVQCQGTDLSLPLNKTKKQNKCLWIKVPLLLTLVICVKPVCRLIGNVLWVKTEEKRGNLGCRGLLLCLNMSFRHMKDSSFSHYTSMEDKAVIMVCGEDVCCEWFVSHARLWWWIFSSVSPRVQPGCASFQVNYLF